MKAAAGCRAWGIARVLKRPFNLARWLAVALPGAAAPTGAFAQTTWLGTGTDWNSAVNWSAGAPVGGVDATLGGAAAVPGNQPTLSATGNVRVLTMNGSTNPGGNTLGLAGQTLNATTINLSAGAINPGSSGGTVNVGTLTMTGGSIGGVAGMTVNATTVNLNTNGVASNVSINASSSIVFNPGSPATFGNNFEGAAGLNVQSGSVTLSGNNTYAGTTQVTGTLTLGSSTAIGSGTLQMNGGTVDLNGQSVSTGALAGSGSLMPTSARSTLPTMRCS